MAPQDRLLEARTVLNCIVDTASIRNYTIQLNFSGSHHAVYRSQETLTFYIASGSFMSNNYFSDLLHRKTIITVVLLAALALLVYVSADAYQRYRAMLDLKAEISAAMQPVSNTVPDKPTVSGTRQVAALSLFGKKEKLAETQPQVIDAPITLLKLTLLGAIAADNEENSRVVIQIDNKKISIVQVGDPLPGTNAVIHQIQPTQVVLMRNGKLERLAINRPELKMDERTGGKDVLINSNSASGESLMDPIDLPSDTEESVPGHGAIAEPNAADTADETSYPPPPFEMPNLLPPKE